MEPIRHHEQHSRTNPPPNDTRAHTTTTNSYFHPVTASPMPTNPQEQPRPSLQQIFRSIADGTSDQHEQQVNVTSSENPFANVTTRRGSFPTPQDQSDIWMIIRHMNVQQQQISQVMSQLMASNYSQHPNTTHPAAV